MSLVSLFGYTIALAALGTSLAMIIMGAKWQRIEQAAYASDKRPWWFVALSVVLIGFYLAALYTFIGGDKTAAGWIMMVVLPVGWTAKALLIVFNSKGRQVVSAIEGRESWVKIGLARLPIAIIFTVLALYS